MKPATALVEEVKRLRAENHAARERLKQAGREAADLMLKIDNLSQHLEATAVSRAQALARVHELEAIIGAKP